MNFSKRFGKLLFAATLLISVNNSVKAQTTLVPGDIAFTGYFGNGATALNDQFSFVLLTNITTGTVINFTDNAWFRTAATFRAGEGTVTFTSTGAIASGTEILITITGGSTATATLVGGGAAPATVTGAVMPALSANGDQILAYQGLVTSPTFISAIHMNVYSVATILPDIPGGDGVTTNTTVWDGDENTANASGLPSTLTNGVNAIWIPGSIIAEKDNAKFNCAGPLTTAAQIRAAVNNVANWVTSDGDPAPTTLPTGCSYISAIPAPSFTTNPGSITICEGTGTTFTAAATGAISYQWQVDAGSGFGNITNNATYSGATTTSLTVTGVTNAMNGYLYRAVATNGTGSTNSTNATLTVTPLPLNPTLLAKTPVTATVADGTNVSATFNAGSGGTTCTDDFRYSINGGASYLPYTPGTNISTTGLAAGSGFVFIEGRRAACASACQNSYVVLASWLVSPIPAGVTTLAAGDIAFSGYIGGNNVAADEFSFVLLKNMGAGTAINFTTTGWLGAAFRTAEETVTWTVPAGGLSAGTEIKIAGLTATRSGPGAAGTVTGTALGCSVNGDQILAYTGASNFISAIHMNVYRTADGDPLTTTAAVWDGAFDDINASALPTGLTTGVNAIWIGNNASSGTEFDNAKFGNCLNPAVPGSITALRAALNNQANWITSNGGDPASFTLPTGCNYLSTLCPTITVTNPGTATGTTGIAFSQTFTSAGGAPTVTYATASTLPTGLTLSTAGVLSGTPTQPGTFPIVVVATDANGCTGTGTSYSLVISCAGVTTPTITPGGPTTFCAGGSVTLTSSDAAGNQWYLNGNPIGSAVNQTYIATASGNYTVVVTIAGPCASSPSAATAVTVNPAPATPTITPGGPTTFCAGGSVTLTSSAATGNQWYLNGNPIGGATNQAYVATASGNYTVDVTVSGCTSTSAVTSVTVNPIPATPTITPGGPTTFCIGGSVTLTSSSASGNQWYLNGNPIGGETNQTYIATTSGDYTVVVTASGCPSAPSAATTVTVTLIPTVNAVNNQAVCAGSTVTIPFSGSQPSATYNWTNTNTAIGLAASGSGDLNFNATNATAGTISGTITVTPVLGTCTGTPISFTISVAVQPAITSVTGDQVCATGGTANLSATGTGTINWYDAITGGNLVNTGTTYSPTVAATTTYYLESVTSINPPQPIVMPGQSGTFSGNVRGYWFTAPTSFVITSLFIPTDASSANQSIAVVKMNGNTPPPTFSTTTNAFTTLFLTQNNPAAGSIPVNIQVQAGDVIGILGSRGGVSSYGPAGGTITINGLNATTARFGMQFPLATTAPQDVWTEAGGSISRVVFEYISPSCISTPRVPVTATANLLPEVTCPGNITQNNTTGQCGSIVTYTTTVTGTPAPTVTYTFTGATTGTGSGDGSGSFFNVGTTTVTVSITNSCGTDDCSFTVTINDTQAPVLTCPAPVTVSCASAVPAANIAAVTGVSDNCSGAVTVTHIGDVISNQTCANRFTITRTYRATDVAGNFTECTQIITVNDITPPVLTCPAPVTVSCASAVPAANIADVTGVSDNCGGVVTVTHIGDVISNQTCANRFTVTRTYRATDVCGNFTECTQIITVNDITPPVLTCPAPVTVSCASAVPAANIADVTGVSDNCGGVVTVTHIGDVISNQTCANRFTVTRTYRATDVCGNFAECTQIITVNDVTPPVLTCPAPVTVSCASAVPAVNIAAVTGVSDNCGGVVTVTHIGDVISNQTCANRFTVTRTYRATDVCGNFAECTQIITVNDVTPPVLTCPAPVTVSCASAVPAANIAAVTGVSDNCGGVVTITHVGDVISGQTCANRFVITRTYRATDVCGNFTDCTQIITVNDQTAPVIAALPNLTAITPIGSCTAVVTFTPSATDNCNGAVTIVSVPASGSAFPIGTTTVTTTATDACGNFSTATFTVTVTDGQLPVITTQPANRTVCTGSSATFSVVATNAVSYQWQQWNGAAWVNVPAANASSFTLNGVTIAQNTNTYRVVITGLCTVINSGAATLYVNPLPTISLVTSGSPVLLPTEAVTITAVTSPAGGTFVWFKNGAAIPGVTGSVLPNLRVNDAGTYRAVYTDPNGCISTSGDIIVSAEISDLLYIYPNPNSGIFHVRFYNQPNERVTLSVYDSKGAMVYRKAVVTGLAYTIIDADISRHGSGTYLVEVRNASGQLVGAKKIIVGHQ